TGAAFDLDAWQDIGWLSGIECTHIGQEQSLPVCVRFVHEYPKYGAKAVEDCRERRRQLLGDVVTASGLEFVEEALALLA
ncbi:MAG: hypothetical protein WBG11_06470, partial [Methylocella sp.]